MSNTLQKMMQDILDSIKVCIPLSRVMANELEILRDAARNRIYKANDVLSKSSQDFTERNRFDLFDEQEK